MRNNWAYFLVPDRPRTISEHSIIVGYLIDCRHYQNINLTDVISKIINLVGVIFGSQNSLTKYLKTS